ncbi:MAG: ABC transporter family substrate-binding protein [Ilumatobacteraceae bacterium]|jgi:peptide/nickel transport system substrate-binding protein
MRENNRGKVVARRFVRVAAAAIVASLALAPMQASAANQDNAGAPDVNPQPVAKLKKGGTFIWATTQLCDNYNTSHVDGNFAGCSYLMSGLLPGTFYTDEQGAFQVDKNYFSDIKLTSRKPQTVTYTLNPKAKWSDGKAIGLADFVGYWKANNGTNEAFEIVSSTGYEDIESVTKGASANQVVVKFKNIYADWQGLFGGLLPASVTASPEKFNSSWKDAPTLSAGPFKWGGTDKVAGTAWIVPNNAWWGDKPVLDKMLWKVVTAAAQLDALANGEVDAANTGPDANQYKRGLGLSGVDVRVSVAPNYRHMTFGNTGFMTDTRVRQAIQMGVDRNVITKALIGPIDSKATPLSNHIFVKGLSCYRDNAGIYGTYNLQKADALLDAAGWVKSGTKRSKGGVDLKPKITIPAGVPTSAQEAQLMQAMLAPLGVQLEINVVPSADFFSKYIIPGNFEMTVFTWLGTSLPISASKSIMTTEGGQNYGKIGTAEIDKLYERANRELDPAKRCTIATQIDKKLWEVGHSMITYQRPDVWQVDAKLANFGAFGFSSGDYTKIGFMK